MGRRYIVTAEQLSLTASEDLINITPGVGGSFTANNTSGQATLTSMSSQTNVVVGSLVFGTGVPAGTTVKSVDSGTQVTLSAVTTGGTTGGTYYFFTAKTVKIIRWWWRPTDNTLATAQVLSTRCQAFLATVTAGSGGSTATIGKVDPGDAAQTFTARKGDTTGMTSTQTAITVDEAGAHVYNGYEEQPENPIPVALGGGFAFQLISSAIQGTVHVSAGVEVEEEA